MAMQPSIFQLNSQKQFFGSFLLNIPSTKRSSNSSASFSLGKTILTAPKACLSRKSESEARPIANFSPGNRLNSLTFNKSELESYDHRVEVLKAKVKEMLLRSDFVEKIILIDTLCRLGVSYHFENEIEENLIKIFNTKLNFLLGKDYDLYAVALVFRVFRQHGFKMSSDVFKKFKDSNGKFKESLVNDVKGILSLFEATHMSMTGEDILDEAFAFTKAYLESSAIESCPKLAKHITNALEQHLHKGIPRIEAIKYIDLYQVDESRNETLLELAKIDYNRVQLLHKQELSHFSKWWKDENISAEVPYARNRMAEIYFWSVAMYFEPQYAMARMIVAKVVSLITLMDDTFDAYATMEEAHILFDAVERWDLSLVDQLPDYMKFMYKLLINTFNEFEKDLEAKGKSYKVAYGREAFKQIVRANYLEAKWRDANKVPSFDEYMWNGGVTCALPLVVTVSFMGVKEISETKVFEWLKTYPKLIQVSSNICRMLNDVMSHETEQERTSYFASCIECYMKEYGVSKKKAIEEIQKLATSYWKDINEQLMNPTKIVSVDLLMRVVNLVRVADVSYKYGDGYTDTEHLKHFVEGLFIHPIPHLKSNND